MDMKVPCKNVGCKHYYGLAQGVHCIAEENCEGYTANKKKATKKIIHCMQCEYCKKIYTNGAREYHYECTFNGRRKLLLFVRDRICDCKV